jgi:adenine-specific DNA-methyltransferase
VDDTVRINRARRAVLGADDTTTLPTAALSVLATLPAWWAQRANRAGLVEDWVAVETAVTGAPPIAPSELATVAVRSELIDASPEEFGEAYVRALGPGLRAKSGRHYTPPALAAALWSQTAQVLPSPVPDGLVFDPAAGAGALLLPPLRAWLAARGDAPPEETIAIVPSMIRGRDLDPAAVWIGNVLLAAELLPVWAQVPSSRRRPLSALLSFGDGLDGQVPPPRVTILNPPYGRVRLGAADRDRWNHALYGHANVYGLFMAAAVAATEREGVVSALVPTSWLGGAYFQRLRSTLAASAPLMRITYVPDRTGVFATGVMQETVLATFHVDGRRQPVVCERLTVNGHTRHEVIGSADLPSSPDQPWMLPRSRDDAALVRAAVMMPYRLADYGWHVSTGPLVWNRHKRQLSRRPRKGSVRIVWAADIDGGRLHQDPARNCMRWCQVRNERERDFLVLDRPAVLVQRTTAPEQPRRVVAATLERDTLAKWGGEVVVENHVNVLTCSGADPSLTSRLLAALLDSEPLDRLYRCLTGSVAVSAYELAALPLPGPEILAAWAALDAQILAKEIRRAYGLPT